MAIFYSTLISTYIFSFLARLAYDKKFKSIAIFWTIFVVVILVIVSGLRNGIGDTSMYKHSYNLLVQNPSSFKFNGDFALGLLSLALIQISTDPQILIFIVALITNLFNVIAFNKYRSYLELQIYMYICSGYYTVTMNGIRQCLAAALVLLCTKFIIEGKFKIYSILVVLISTIHASALIMIPLYFIVRQESWSKIMFKFIGLAIIGIVFYQILSPVLFSIIENTSYGEYVHFKEGGSSVFRTIVNAVPVILAYIKRNELKEKWTIGNIFVNISIINLIFVSFGMFNWIFNRFTLYFQLYNFILVPYIIMNCAKGKERRLLYFIFVVCYFIFFYREQVIGLNIKYKSDYFDWDKIFYKVIQ